MTNNKVQAAYDRWQAASNREYIRDETNPSILERRWRRIAALKAKWEELALAAKQRKVKG